MKDTDTWEMKNKQGKPKIAPEMFCLYKIPWLKNLKSKTQKDQTLSK